MKFQNSNIKNQNSEHEIKAVLISVLGDVQGVNFRHWTKKTAQNLGIVGWTKNEHDGTVTIFAQGYDESIDRLISWAKEGSPMATVEKVKVKETAVDENLKGFVVK